MNDINFFHVGQSYELSKSFTQEEVSLFADLSLDKNPVHLSEEYAKETIFKRRIVHGFLTGSLISAIIGNYLPGNGSIYLYQDMKFLKPVYVGEKIFAKVTIIDIIEEKRHIRLSACCYKSSGEVVLEGVANVKYL